MRTVSLWWRTLLHVKGTQMFCRARRTLAALLPRDAPLPLDRLPVGYRTPEFTPVQHALSGTSLTFLNRTADCSVVIPWNDAQLPQLWRFHLHYFDYARRLEGFAAFRRLASSWIEANRRTRGDGWHPFTISRRIVNWLEAADRFSGELNADAGFRRLLFGSIYGQSRFLASNLEFDARGNHLFENLRALLIAGLAFEGAEAARWRRRALALLESELREQVLADGGHFERTPAYHVEVLRGLLEIHAWFEANGQAAPGWCLDAARRMHGFLGRILAPDGSLPLLKDTTLDGDPIDPALLAAAGLTAPAPSRESAALAATGFFVMRDDTVGHYLVFDAGKPCPDYLPAHAHADALSFELHVAGVPVVVDSGVFEYRAGPWRNYFRSTRAHNTVEVEGENQSEVWGSFRVARRARIQSVSWEDRPESITVAAEHDGYERLRVPVRHRRTIRWNRGGLWEVEDELRGRGPTRAASHVHFHPSIEPVAEGDGIWLLRGAPCAVRLRARGQDGASLVRGLEAPVRQGWHSPRFGVIEPNYVLTFHREGALPSRFGFTVDAGGTGA